MLVAISFSLVIVSVRPRLLALGLGDELGHLGQQLEEVSLETIIRDLEDGRLLVLVDGHDRLGVLHARQVLDGPRDAHLRVVCVICNL